jgi:heme A synthase
LLAAAIAVVTFARAKTSGWIRRLLIGIAFLLMIPAFFGMLIVVIGVK